MKTKNSYTIRPFRNIRKKLTWFSLVLMGWTAYQFAFTEDSIFYNLLLVLLFFLSWMWYYSHPLFIFNKKEIFIQKVKTPQYTYIFGFLFLALGGVELISLDLYKIGNPVASISVIFFVFFLNKSKIDSLIND